MVKKSALGKGLSALIPDDSNNEISNNEISNTKLDINLIKPNSGQPRKNFDEEKLKELSDSIKIHGLVQPIVVNKDGDTYTIVAGERRWRACKALKIKNVPVVIMNYSEEEIMEISLIENIQRENLNPIETAKALKKLLETYKMTQDEIAMRLSKSRSSITNIMRLLNLDSRIQEYIIDGIISEGHGRALLAIKSSDEQYTIAHKIIDEKLTVRQTEEFIKKLSKENDNKKQKEEIIVSPYIKETEVILQNYFGTKVSILNNNKNKKGKIEIEYYSDEDLNRILEIISKKSFT